MKSVLVYVLKLFVVSIVSADSVGLGCRLCKVEGAFEYKQTNNYHIPVSDLTDRCDIFVYGNYWFLPNILDDGSNMYKVDEDNIRTLVGNNKTVFLFVGFNGDDHWDQIFEPTDQASYEKIESSLLAKIKELKVAGIIIGISDLYDTITIITDYANKVCGFVDKIKKQVPNLKFGLLVDATFNSGDIIKRTLHRK